jgi:hypothetical protein
MAGDSCRIKLLVVFTARTRFLPTATLRDRDLRRLVSRMSASGAQTERCRSHTGLSRSHTTYSLSHTAYLLSHTSISKFR